MTVAREEVRDAVLAVIAQQLNKPSNTLQDADTLVSLGADSLDQVEIVMKLEERFGIEINDSDAEKLTTVGQAIDYVHGLVSRA